MNLETLPKKLQISNFNTPWKCKKARRFLTFSGGIEIEPEVFQRFQGV